MSTLHRLADNGRLYQDSETILNGMSCPGVRIDRHDLAVPCFQHASRSHSVQDGPLLRWENEDRDLLAMRHDVAAQQAFNTDIYNVLEAGVARKTTRELGCARRYSTNQQGCPWVTQVSH